MGFGCNWRERDDLESFLHFQLNQFSTLCCSIEKKGGKGSEFEEMFLNSAFEVSVEQAGEDRGSS